MITLINTTNIEQISEVKFQRGGYKNLEIYLHSEKKVMAMSSRGE